MNYQARANSYPVEPEERGRPAAVKKAKVNLKKGTPAETSGRTLTTP